MICLEALGAMVKFTIEEIRALMDYKHNIRNMSGAPLALELDVVLARPAVAVRRVLGVTRH